MFEAQTTEAEEIARDGVITLQACFPALGGYDAGTLAVESAGINFVLPRAVIAGHVDIAVDRFGIAVAVRIQEPELPFTQPHAHGGRWGRRVVGPHAEDGADYERSRSDDANKGHDAP